MKDYFKNLRKKPQDLSSREQAVAELVVNPHAVIVPAKALRIEKQLKTGKKHHRTGEVRTAIREQKKSVTNYQQRLLEKDKTKQKKERRFVEIAA